MNVLIADNNRISLEVLSAAIEKAKCTAFTALTFAQTKKQLEQEDIDALIIDRSIGKKESLDLLDQVSGDMPIILISENPTVEEVVEGMQHNAHSYFPKPLVDEQIRLLVKKLHEEIRSKQKITQLAENIDAAQPGLILESKSPTARQAFEMARKAAKSEASILLLGPSGSGKTVLAHHIHQCSLRKDENFVTVSCPSLSKDLLESELFGYVKGAFTGAVNDSWGKVRAANHGTLFLDEIGEMPLEMQPKLLRLLQEQQYERLGESKTRNADIRVVSATNQNIDEALADERLREDLLYRLNVITIEMPALKNRMEDIELLANNALQYYRVRQNRPKIEFSKGSIKAMQEYDWPGNLRELSNVIERATILAENNMIEPVDLSLGTSSTSEVKTLQVGQDISIDDLVQEHVQAVVERTERLEDAASILGIDQATLYRKRKKMAID